MKNLFILILTGLIFFSCERLVDPDRLTDRDDRKDEPVDDREDWDDEDNNKDDDKDDKDDDKPCFRVLFPRSYVLSDGTVITADSEKGLDLALAEWKRSNPDRVPNPELQYPVTIAWGDGLIEIQNEEMMDAYKRRCDKMKDRDKDKDDRGWDRDGDDGDRDNDRDEDEDEDDEDEDDEDEDDEDEDDGRDGDNSDERR